MSPYQFQIVSSANIEQLRDKIVQQDILLKLGKKTIDEIVCDLSTQVKSTNDELRQQSLLFKKHQEDNHSLHKSLGNMLQSTDFLDIINGSKFIILTEIWKS